MFGSRKSKPSDLEVAESNMISARNRFRLGDRDAIVDRTLAEVQVGKLRSARDAQNDARRGWFS